MVHKSIHLNFTRLFYLGLRFIRFTIFYNRPLRLIYKHLPIQGKFTYHLPDSYTESVSRISNEWFDVRMQEWSYG